MCGIVGAIAFNKLNKKDEQDRQKIMRYMTTELLLLTEDRGKDATGAAILFSDGNYVGMKRGEKASDFLSKLGESKERYGGLLKIWKEHEYPVKAYLGHARAISQGSKDDNANNHPIKIGNIIGIHNGTLKNDDIIIKNLKCKRDGQVDSEAIFRLFEYYTNKGKEPFTLDMVQDVVRRLEGQFAVTLFNSDNPYQVPVFRDSRPVEFVFIKKYRILFIVSELKFWSEVLFKYESDIFYHGLKYPSLLECDIKKESLVDDSCMIFDLMSKIDEDTKIRDLGVWRKMERTGKIWTVASDRVHRATAGFKGVGSYNSRLSNTETKNKDEDVKPKRIFDRITKKYTSGGEEKILADDESIIIPAGTGGNEKDNNENTSENENLELKSTDEEKQESTEPATEIKDLTIYNKEKNKTDVIEKNNGIEKDNNDTVDVDMTTEPPEYVSAAEEEYKKLNFHKKGYNTTDELLDAVEKRNENELNILDNIVFANKVFKDGWKKGFVVGCKYLLLKMFDGKNKKRENHIVNLKRLVMILVTFLDHIHIIGTSHHDNIINKKMNSIALEYIANHNSMPNMAELRQIFNIYEKGKLKNVDCIISEVSKYKEEGE